jgi:viologen exporter family transport system permease protein
MKTMLARRLRLTRVLLSVTLAAFIEYRAEVLIWMIAGTLPLIMMFIWMGLAANGPVGGYTAADFAAYFLLVFIVRQFTVCWVVQPLSREIRLGEMSARLMRPLDPYWMYVADHLVALVMRLPIVPPVVLIGLALTGAFVKLSIAALPLFLLAIVGAWMIRFNMHYTLGLVAFWTDQATSFEGLLFTIYMVFGGALFPINLLPPVAQEIIALTPFSYMIGFPVDIMLGKLSNAEVLRGFGMQALWTLVFIGTRQLTWRHGLKRYSAVGA